MITSYNITTDFQIPLRVSNKYLKSKQDPTYIDQKSIHCPFAALVCVWFAKFAFPNYLSYRSLRGLSNLPATFLLNSFLSKLAPLTTQISDSDAELNDETESVM